MSLADLLALRRNDIVERFVHAMREAGFSSDDTTRSELILDIPFFLADLEETLRRTQADARFEPPASTTARAHGRARYRLGFDLGSLVREYGLLRQCVVDTAAENDVMLSRAELDVVLRAIDAALAEAASAYAARRDAELVSERDALATERSRLEEAVRFREDVVAIVSHDLRGPLTAISLTLRQLRRLPLTPENEARRDGYCDTLGRSVDRMSRLISDLLDVATIEAGTLKVEPQLTPASSLLSDAIEGVRPLADQKSIRIVTPPIDDDVMLLCDRERTLQVLANLLGNAVKFTPDRGEVTLDLKLHGDEATVEVRDSGPGIPREQLPFVFERFYQGSGGQKRRGAGLGLAIAKGIVEAHGRQIGVDSDEGKGSTFRFTLPAMRRSHAAAG